jgi:hypothetical protein
MGTNSTNNGKIPFEEWTVDFGISDHVASCSQGAKLCSNRQFTIANHVVQHMPAWPRRTVSWYLPQNGAKILTPNPVANEDDPHNGGTTILPNLLHKTLETNTCCPLQRTSRLGIWRRTISNILPQPFEWLVPGCFRHADTAPLEGLLIFRCAIYDPLEGLQISKMTLAEMWI